MARQQFRVNYFSLKQPISDADIAYITGLKDRMIVCDVEAAYSEFHIRSALEEALAVRRRSRKYQNLAALFMMYLTGKKQIKDAIRVAGITQATVKFFAICIDECSNLPLDSEIFRKSTEIGAPIPLRDEQRDEDACWRMTRLSLYI
jgi:tRNA threonylcarbamoyladenosine modification (KEOPS) complex Cgi121 subunit